MFLRVFSSFLLLAGFLFQPLQAMAETSETPILKGQVYGVLKQQFTEAAVGHPPGSYMVEKCVFFPVGQKAYRDRNQASEAVAALTQLTVYGVIDRTGKPIDSRFSTFQVFVDDYPKYYAGSVVPKTGCGSALVTGNLVERIKEPPVLANRDRFERLFREQELQFYDTALKTTSDSTPESARKEIGRINLEVAFTKSSKSSVEVFHDGHDWYMARSYVVEFFTAMPIRTLLLYKIDERAGTLKPQAVFLNTKIGEEARSKIFASVLDVDGDGQKEILVQESGIDAPKFSLLRRRGERWE
jgi:hypothetical protein